MVLTCLRNSRWDSCSVVWDFWHSCRVFCSASARLSFCFRCSICFIISSTCAALCTLWASSSPMRAIVSNKTRQCQEWHEERRRLGDVPYHYTHAWRHMLTKEKKREKQTGVWARKQMRQKIYDTYKKSNVQVHVYLLAQSHPLSNITQHILSFCLP